MALDPLQQSQLFAAKLRALSRDGLGIKLDEVRGLAEGAVGFHNESRSAVYLAETNAMRSLGRALALAVDEGSLVIHLLCAEHASVVARRAEYFDIDIKTWSVEGSSLTRSAAAAHLGSIEPSEAASALLADIVAAGADPVVEHGVLIGEVRGLEIVRAEEHNGVAELRVGVGDFDRDAFGLLHGAMPTLEAIRGTVEIVALQRAPGAAFHPLNRVASERWLRSLLADDPHRIGCESLMSAEPPATRVSVMDPAPAIAIGVRGGVEHVVAVSTGIDLELIPYAADARSRLAPEADLLVVVPVRDAHRVTRELAALLHKPAEIVTIDDDWRSWSSDV